MLSIQHILIWNGKTFKLKSCFLYSISFVRSLGASYLPRPLPSLSAENERKEKKRCEKSEWMEKMAWNAIASGTEGRAHLFPLITGSAVVVAVVVLVRFYGECEFIWRITGEWRSVQCEIERNEWIFMRGVGLSDSGKVRGFRKGFVFAHTFTYMSRHVTCGWKQPNVTKSSSWRHLTALVRGLSNLQPTAGVSQRAKEWPEMQKTRSEIYSFRSKLY